MLIGKDTEGYNNLYHWLKAFISCLIRQWEEWTDTVRFKGDVRYKFGLKTPLPDSSYCPCCITSSYEGIFITVLL